jgi:hypothetical protein
VRRLGLLGAVGAGAAALAVPAGAQAPLRALTITPALAEGVSYPGQRIGPFTILNTSGKRYAVDVFPVLVGQRIDGSLFVREDPASRARARRFIDLGDEPPFPLGSGEARSVSSAFSFHPPERDFYGGVLFKGVPAESAEKSPLVQVLQLNARISLRPPPELEQVVAKLASVRAEQAGNRGLRFLVRLANKGNVAVRPEGALRVLDASGNVRFRGRLGALQVIPGYTVDLPVPLTSAVLPTGTYTVDARVRIGAKLLRMRAPMELFGPNQVATRRAEILSVDLADAYIGREARVEVGYRNTGNVPFAPRMSIEVSDGTMMPLATESTAPGAEGHATGVIRFDDARPREVTVRLKADGRPVDSRTISVTPVELPPVYDRVENWIVEHALLLVGALAGLVGALLALVANLLLRRRPA